MPSRHFPTKRRGGVVPSCMLSILRYTCRRQDLYSRIVLKTCSYEKKGWCRALMHAFTPTHVGDKSLYYTRSVSYEKKGWCRALMHDVHTKVHMQETYVVLRLSLQNIMEESYSCLIMHYVCNTPVCNEDKTPAGAGQCYHSIGWNSHLPPYIHTREFPSNR